MFLHSQQKTKILFFLFLSIASGGYVDVGRVLLERGADVNAPPVPTSKDTGTLDIIIEKNRVLFDEFRVDV